MSDMRRQVKAVSRRLGLLERDGKAAHVLVAEQTYDAEIDDVWDAITNYQRIPRWFLPVSGDLRVGGQYQLEGNANGTIMDCDRPRRLAVTWEYDSQVSWLEVRLSAGEPGRTSLELRHTSHVDDRWAEFGPGAVGIGWDLTLLGLGLNLAGDESIRPQDAASWMASDGRQFMILSGREWLAASIAAGDDEESATAAAARCIAAYTGAPAADDRP